MALYSKEYLESVNQQDIPDFSIQEEFKKLKEDSSIEIICEGFGITKILDKDGECFVVAGSKEVSFEEFCGIDLKKKESYRGLYLLFGGITLLFCISWFLIVKLIPAGTEGTARGVFGDMFGSVNALFSGLALGGIIFTIFLQKKELKLQRNELKETRKEFTLQNKTLSLQRFENTFFQMLNLHHEIIDKLKFENLFDKRDVLRQASIQLVQQHSQNRKEYLKRPNDIGQVIYSREFMITNIEEAYELLKSTYLEFYIDKYELILSHYYRNLYHIFKYIYLSNIIAKEEKQFYASLMRAQLSPDELLLIYYNSLTPNLGNPNFLFLVKEFDLMQNYNIIKLAEFEYHQEIFKELCTKVENPFIQKKP